MWLTHFSQSQRCVRFRSLQIQMSKTFFIDEDRKDDRFIPELHGDCKCFEYEGEREKRERYASLFVIASDIFNVNRQGKEKKEVHVLNQCMSMDLDDNFHK